MSLHFDWSKGGNLGGLDIVEGKEAVTELSDLAEVNPLYLRLYDPTGPHSLMIEDCKRALRVGIHFGNSFAGLMVNQEQAAIFLQWLERWLNERPPSER